MLWMLQLIVTTEVVMIACKKAFCSLQKHFTTPGESKCRRQEKEDEMLLEGVPVCLRMQCLSCLPLCSLPTVAFLCRSTMTL